MPSKPTAPDFLEITREQADILGTFLAHEFTRCVDEGRKFRDDEIKSAYFRRRKFEVESLERLLCAIRPVRENRSAFLRISHYVGTSPVSFAAGGDDGSRTQDDPPIGEKEIRVILPVDFFNFGKLVVLNHGGGAFKVECLPSKESAATVIQSAAEGDGK